MLSTTWPASQPNAFTEMFALQTRACANGLWGKPRWGFSGIEFVEVSEIPELWVVRREPPLRMV